MLFTHASFPKAMSTIPAATQSDQDIDATFESQITTDGKFVLNELKVDVHSVIGYMCPAPTTDADSDDTRIDRRCLFGFDWDLHTRDSVATEAKQPDLTPATAFKYGPLYDSMTSHMLRYGDEYLGTTQVLLIRVVDMIGQSDMLMVKIYGEEEQNIRADWCTDCNFEDALVYMRWCRDCKRWERAPSRRTALRRARRHTI
ncbi:uncharacterized protein C8Q71DRAFT_854387 [Rhodofomes roseus]|nr:uncharacterized protein C8Q71DRAFT_854387 [Rhodofomes roseus]KAH9842032.1 hypothetical protein C8Q71DRAFT_854387 [Rhodofomes roseus]